MAPQYDYEQRLREEVIYLHSLWHQGPPRPAASHSLQPSNATHFKNEKRTRRLRARKSKKRPDSEPSPGREWPCPTPPAETTSTWANSAPQPALLSQSPTPEEQSKLAAKKAQFKAVETVRDFFNGNDTDGEFDSNDSNGDEDNEFLEEDDERREYTFFLKVFMEDAELKEYYVKNFVKGEFTCLVCGALGGKNTGKKFKGCLPLVQHSVTIAKTKKRRAHRAYGQAVCKILSWDMDRLSTIVSMLSDHSGEAQDNVNPDNNEKSIDVSPNLESGDGNNDAVLLENSIPGGEILPGTDEGIMHSSAASAADNTLEGPGVEHPCNVEETVADGLTNNSLVAADANNILEGLGIAHPSNVKETVEEGLTANSLMSFGVNTTLEDLSMVHSSIASEPATWKFATESPNDEIGVGVVIPICRSSKEGDKEGYWQE